MVHGQLQHFIEMGGYGIYVWPAYGITFAVLLMNIIVPCIRHRQLLRQPTSSSSIQIITTQSHVTDS